MIDRHLAPNHNVVHLRILGRRLEELLEHLTVRLNVQRGHCVRLLIGTIDDSLKRILVDLRGRKNEKENFELKIPGTVSRGEFLKNFLSLRKSPLTLRPFIYHVILLGGKEAPTVQTAFKLSPTFKSFLSIFSSGCCFGRSMTRIVAAFIAVWKKGASSDTSHSKMPFRWRVTPRSVTWF